VGASHRVLLDASALYFLAVSPEKYVGLLDNLCILDLTVYEIGNAALMAWRRGLLKDYEAFMERLRLFLEDACILRLELEDLAGIAETASGTGLTFYDASYVYAARKHGLLLVTEDKEILKKAPETAQRLQDLSRSPASSS